MDSTKQTSLETFLLLALHASAQLGLRAESMLPRARLEIARELTAPELASTLRSLADRGLVLATDSALGGPRWRITETGAAKLTEYGLL